MSISNLDDQLGIAPPEPVSDVVDAVETVDELIESDDNLHLENTSPDDNVEAHEIAAKNDHDPYAPGNEDEEPESQEEDNDEPEAASLDEYGNELAEPKTYTEDEVNERINAAVRARLARGSHKEQDSASEVKDNFNFDQSDEGDWQQQLERFVEHTVSGMTKKQQQQQNNVREQQIQQQFEQKFNQGMAKFNDFSDVVGNQPITDAMMIGSRDLENPAAFLYAASKRHPDEIQKISRMQDPYAQMTAIGRLDERMRKPKTAPTKAPRPISKTKGDASPKVKAKSTMPSLDDMLAQNDASRSAALRKARRV